MCCKRASSRQAPQIYPYCKSFDKILSAVSCLSNCFVLDVKKTSLNVTVEVLMTKRIKKTALIRQGPHQFTGFESFV